MDIVGKQVHPGQGVGLEEVVAGGHDAAAARLHAAFHHVHHRGAALGGARVVFDAQLRYVGVIGAVYFQHRQPAPVRRGDNAVLKQLTAQFYRAEQMGVFFFARKELIHGIPPIFFVPGVKVRKGHSH